MAETEVDRAAPVDLFGWRRRQLRISGFPAGLAAEIAGDWHFDLHLLIELTERGCPPELAVRILAPLGDER